MTKTLRLACLLGAMALLRPAGAAVYSVAGLAGPLDSGGAGARALGMGSAFVGVADDPSALYWNPAGLGGLDDVELALNHNSWLAGIIQENAELTLPAGVLGTLAASVDYINYGNLAGYDSSGASTGDYSADRYGINLGWGKELAKGFSLGLGLKGSTQSISGQNYSNLAVDLGALIEPARGLRFGLTYTDLGNQVAGYAQPADLNLGASFGFQAGRNNHLLLAASGTWENNGVNTLQLGLEDVVHQFLSARAGYRAVSADTQIDGLTGLSLGLGLKLGRLGVDYAYLPYGDLGTTHRISLTFAFGAEDRPRRRAS
jgi:hypothetical protein